MLVSVPSHIYLTSQVSSSGIILGHVIMLSCWSVYLVTLISGIIQGRVNMLVSIPITFI